MIGGLGATRPIGIGLVSPSASYNSLLFAIVSLPVFEPSILGLRVECSTTERSLDSKPCLRNYQSSALPTTPSAFTAAFQKMFARQNTLAYHVVALPMP